MMGHMLLGMEKLKDRDGNGLAINRDLSLPMPIRNMFGSDGFLGMGQVWTLLPQLVPPQIYNVCILIIKVIDKTRTV